MLIKVGDEVTAKKEDLCELQSIYSVKHIINPDIEHATLVCTCGDGDSYYFKLGEVDLYRGVSTTVHSNALFTNNEQPEKVNTGDLLVVNASGGMKFDGTKPRPTILLKDLKDAVASVVSVLEYGAKKYNRMNYSKVETERYEDSISRHLMAYLAGEKKDPETGEHHLAHMICGAMFIIQKGD